MTTKQNRGRTPRPQSSAPLFLRGTQGKNLAIKTGIRAGTCEQNKKGG